MAKKWYDRSPVERNFLEHYRIARREDRAIEFWYDEFAGPKNRNGERTFSGRRYIGIDANGASRKEYFETCWRIHAEDNICDAFFPTANIEEMHEKILELKSRGWRIITVERIK